MNFHSRTNDNLRWTSAEQVFEQLRSDIVNLKLMPGAKLSEAEVAKSSNVSRQPVREAFGRLSDMNLLLIRPQKATVVRKISVQEILNTRFIRTAIEVELVRKACATPKSEVFAELADNLELQEKAVTSGNSDRFHTLDYEFHRLMCCAAGLEFVFKTLAEKKAHVDRLCMISLADDREMETLLEDHRVIFSSIQTQDEATAVAQTRIHLARLDRVLENARRTHPEYFED